MNITDIDDKIIVRARRTELLRRYRERCLSGSVGKADVCERVLEAANKTLIDEQEKCEKLTQEYESLSSAEKKDSKEITAAETALKEEELKRSQAEGALSKAKEAASAFANDKSGSEKLLMALLESAKDSLAESLDKEEGHVFGGSDHEIFKAHATKFEGLFHEDMDILGVKPPTILTRVSEYVPEVVSYIEGIEKKGMAYASNGSVYFDTHAFIKAGHEYRKLEPMAKAIWEEIKAGKGEMLEEGAEKKSQMDFALWKKSKAGEPAWESPWGPGRPGWHIECSAMAGDVLGEYLDIHAGGEDLRFPHHDNEIAQSEAFCGCKQWVNYFLHAGHLHIKGLKMSKSLKNFVTIRQALDEHSASQIRLLFLMQNWDRPMLYSDQMVDDAKAKESMLKNFFGTVKALLREIPATKFAQVEQRWLDDEYKLHDKFIKCQSLVHSSLCANFDYPSAMEAIFSLVSETNKYINDPGRKPRVMLLKSIALYITKILRTFGLIEDSIGYAASGSGGGSEGVVEKYLDAFVLFRDELRTLAREKGLKEVLELCDNVRDNVLIDLGVRVEDRNSAADGQGSLWKLDDPAVLKKELEEKRQKQKEAAEKKKKNKIAALSKDLKRWEAATVSPDKLFLGDDRFGKCDEKGLPVEMANGEPLSKKMSKNVAKEMDKQAKSYKLLQEKPGGAEAFLDGLRKEIEALQIQ